MDSKMALQQEDIVSWIEEFSYIYSSGLFDLDDIQLSEENECHSGKAPSEDDLVLRSVPQYPAEHSDTTTRHVESFSRSISSSGTHTYEAYIYETGSMGTQYIESDEESIDHLKSNPSLYGDILGGEKKVVVHHKGGSKKRKLFGGHSEKRRGSSHPISESLQVHPASWGRDSSKILRLLGPSSCLSLRQPEQPKERWYLYSQPEDKRETLDSLPRNPCSRHRVTRKPGRCPLRDSSELDEHRTGSTTSSATSNSWLSDMKCRLKSLYPGSLKRKASTLRLRDKACLSPDDFQDAPSRVHPLPPTAGFMSSRTLPLPQHITRDTPMGSKTQIIESNVSDCQSSHTATQKHDLETTAEAQVISYQCTFCLAQCTNKLDWMQHERVYHFKSQQRWANAPERFSESADSHIFTPTTRDSSDTCVTGSSERLTSQGDIDGFMEDLFWNCGFCNFVLRSWDERQEHISQEHFEKGITMALWDPLKAPFPWKRRIGAPIPRFSTRGMEEFLATQGLEQANSMDGNSETSIRNASVCKLCDLPSEDKEAAAKHKEMWHEPRSVWFCPAPFAPDDMFFDTSKRSDGSVRDICLCCGKSFKYTQRDPEILMRHLRNAHGFDDYPCLQMCFDKEQFYLHLANSHDFYLEFIQDFMVSCEWRGGAPAMMLESN